MQVSSHNWWGEVAVKKLLLAGFAVGALVAPAFAADMPVPVAPVITWTGMYVGANGGYFEGDVSRGNLFRDELVSMPYELGKDGCVRPLEGIGLGLTVNEEFLQKHPVIEGPGYV